MQRARQHGVAEVTWQSIDGRQVAFASGAADAVLSCAGLHVNNLQGTLRLPNWRPTCACR